MRRALKTTRFWGKNCASLRAEHHRKNTRATHKMVRRERVKRNNSRLKVLQVSMRASELRIRFKVAHDKFRNIATRADHELEMGMRFPALCCETLYALVTLQKHININHREITLVNPGEGRPPLCIAILTAAQLRGGPIVIRVC